MNSNLVRVGELFRSFVEKSFVVRRKISTKRWQWVWYELSHLLLRLQFVFFFVKSQACGLLNIIENGLHHIFFWICSHVRNCATSRALRQAFALINFWIWTPVGIFPFWIISLNALSTVLRSISVQRRCVCPDRAAGMDFRLLFAAAIFLPCRDRFAVSSASESMMSESITVLSLFNSFFF